MNYKTIPKKESSDNISELNIGTFFTFQRNGTIFMKIDPVQSQDVPVDLKTLDFREYDGFGVVLSTGRIFGFKDSEEIYKAECVSIPTFEIIKK